jgi:hypothetical protein
MSPRIITIARILFIAFSPLVAVAAGADAPAPLSFQYNDRPADYQVGKQGTKARPVAAAIGGLTGTFSPVALK